MNMNTPYDRMGIIMLSADRVERFIMVCLSRGGSSGCLESGVTIYT